jgi:prolyl-tRNA editing enzyme YbaK/EbsC (Cys-tRNA(Pro) deacylase)
MPRSVDDVRVVLEPRGYHVLELPDDTSTAPLAAEALRTPVATIVKSLLFLAADEPVLVLAAGDRRVSPPLLALHLGVSAVRLARPKEVLDITGYPVGGVPPVAHEQPLRTAMDRYLLGHDVVYAAAGAANAVFGIPPRELLTLAGAEPADVSE